MLRSKYHKYDQTKEEEMGGAFNMHERYDKCIQDFGSKLKDTKFTSNTKAQTGGKILNTCILPENCRL